MPCFQNPCLIAQFALVVACIVDPSQVLNTGPYVLCPCRGLLLIGIASLR